MKLTVLRSLTLPAMLGLALTAGCGTPPNAADGPAPVELRSYRIPAGYESEVPSMLRSAFGSEGHGRVSAGPAGTVIVVAPAGVQRGVAEFMKELEQAGAPAAGPRPVLLSYWMVLGRPEAGIAGVEVERGTALDEIDRALREIAASQGPQRFKLLERIQLTSVGDGFATTQGRFAQVGQRATVLGDEVLAQVDVTMRGHKLQTQVKLRPGQVAVLAQTGVDAWATDATNFPAENLYYVVTSKIE